jgi:hypothetical protein
MSPKAVILAIVGAVCVGAAAAGGFMAIRMNHADQAIAAVGAPNPPTAADATSATVPPIPAAVAPVTPDPEPSASPAPAKTSTLSAAKKSPASPTPSPAHSQEQPLAVTPAPPKTVTPPADVPTPPLSATTTTSSTPPDQQAQADAPPPDPPKPQFDELTVKTDSVIGIVLETAVSSDKAKVEDKVTAHVTRDVTVDGRVAIPANSRLEGVVSVVERGGKFSAQSRVGLKFTTLYLPDNTKLPIQTDTIFRVGEGPGNEATAKIGAGAVVGAILGGIIGGKKGAAIGAGAGAAGGTAAVAAGKTNDATFAAGSPVTLRLTAPVIVTVQRDSNSGRP